jgi:hypothetical protein
MYRFIGLKARNGEQEKIRNFLSFFEDLFFKNRCILWKFFLRRTNENNNVLYDCSVASCRTAE